MNTLKKVGLTALAGSLVVTSAVAGEMSVAGSASIGLKNTSKSATGKSQSNAFAIPNIPSAVYLSMPIKLPLNILDTPFIKPPN